MKEVWLILFPPLLNARVGTLIIRYTPHPGSCLHTKSGGNFWSEAHWRFIYFRSISVAVWRHFSRWFTNIHSNLHNSFLREGTFMDSILYMKKLPKFSQWVHDRARIQTWQVWISRAVLCFAASRIGLLRLTINLFCDGNYTHLTCQP